MEIKLRLEEGKDYRQVEEITREAFWNMYVPGCDEHLLVHNLRKKTQFIKALDFVATYNDKIGGIGGKLITHTAQLAKEMGYKAILIYGEPEYYKRFGFKESKSYNVTNKDKKYPAALLALELYPNALKGITGIFDDGEIYQIDPEELNEFEKGFPEKEKKSTQTQERFLEMVTKFL